MLANTNSTTSSTAASTSNRHRGRRVALRVAIAAGALGVAGLGPLAASASAYCPEAAPACAAPVQGLPSDGATVSAVHPSIEQIVTAGAEVQGAATGTRLPDHVLGARPGSFELPEDEDAGDDHDRPGVVIVHHPQQPVVDTATPGSSSGTTTDSVPGDSRTESAGPAVADRAGSLAFTGGGTQLALVGVGLAAVGALAIGGTAVARRRTAES